MSNGIASGVPPADGGAGGEAGGVVCEYDGELMTAMTQAATASEATERTISSRLKFLFLASLAITPHHIGGVNPSLP
jgi:hypothetical protein